MLCSRICMNRNALNPLQHHNNSLVLNNIQYFPILSTITQIRSIKSVHNPLNKRSKKRRKKRAYQSYKFLDKITVTATAGAGGKGCMSFEHLNPWKKRPTGGHGGNGGSVIIMVDDTQQNLPLGRKLIKGENGTAGGSNMKFGKDGDNYILRVPRGVIVWKKREFHIAEEEFQERKRMMMQEDQEKVMEWEEEQYRLMVEKYEKEEEEKKKKKEEQQEDGEGEDGDMINEEEEEEEKMELLADLDQPNSYLVIAKGGTGGRGNGTTNRRTDTTDPTFSHAQIGESIQIVLELKLIADVGFVGLPNAGKSSLLYSLSKATPKIAPYKFTTLYPKLGTIQYTDGKLITCADLPGLIEGASVGRGRGISFLKHLDRTRVLLYLIDINYKPLKVLQLLLNELEKHDNGTLLYEKNAIIVLNKIDLLSKDIVNDKVLEMSRFIEKYNSELITNFDINVIGISAGVTGDGLEYLTKVIRNTVLEENVKSIT